MIHTSKTTTTEKRILSRIQRILPLMLLSIVVDRYNQRYVAFFCRHDTIWRIPDIDYDYFYVSVNSISWAKIRSYKERIYRKPAEKLYYYEKRCKVCGQIFSSNKISKDQYEMLCDNRNIKIIPGPGSCRAEISSVCEMDAEEYFARA